MPFCPYAPRLDIDDQTGKMIGSGERDQPAAGSEAMPHIDANPDIAIEAAARALCRHAGHPENTKFEGRPMWESFLPEAKVAIEAARPHLQDMPSRQ